jgi:hypothetical protein
MLSERPVVYLQLPSVKGTPIRRPERVVLAFPSSESIDIGAFCYTRRAKSAGRRTGRAVDLTSFDQRRVAAVRAAIRYFCDLHFVVGKRLLTVHTACRMYRNFLDFADVSGHVNAMLDVDAAKAALKHYSKHLLKRLKGAEISDNQAATLQTGAIQVMSDLMQTELADLGLYKFRRSKSNPTEPPPDEDKSRVLALCHSLFHGLSEFCLNSLPYPHGLRVPPSLKCTNNVLWIFPCRKFWCMPPQQLKRRASLDAPHWAFDFENGGLALQAQIRHHYVSNSAAGGALKRAQAAIDKGNSTGNNEFRRAMGFIAHNAFVLLFMLHTGQNRAGIAELSWGGDFDVKTERQGFRLLKYRAKGREVSFEIQSTFMPSFRKFIALREYLLRGEKHDLLFLAETGLRSSITEKRYQPFPVYWIDGFYQVLRRLDPEVPVLRARKLRAAKSDWAVRNEGIESASVMLQHSPETIKKSYVAGTEIRQHSELTEFFDQLSSVVLDKGKKVRNATTIAVGACKKHGSPNAMISTEIKPDCQSPEGCFFCDKHKVHADEKDVRKLLSCRYCIEQTQHLADSEEQFQLLFKPVLDRIQSLLDEIDLRSPGIVQRIRAEVNAGELDPYWLGKLEMLIDLELV